MNATVHWRVVSCPRDPEEVYAALFARSAKSFWLDGAATERSRFSFMGDASGPLAESLTYDLGRRVTVIEDAAGRREDAGPFLPLLEARWAERRTPSVDLPFDFQGGYVGVLGYELKGECDGDVVYLPDEPAAAVVFADRFLAFDHHAGEVFAVELGDAPSGWLDAVQARLLEVPALEPPAPAPRTLLASSRHDREAYCERITRCLAHIADGESYELCLTNTLTLQSDEPSLSIYRRLRRATSAPYGALLRFGSLEVMSGSPEKFLTLNAEGAVESRPIKGTRPRGEDPRADADLREELATSDKDRAENLMIVDLLRNDLGRVCETGSVQVPELFAVESYRTVHHLVSVIRGQLRPELGAIDLLRATFPGGSMTGAPKKRAMELLEALEDGPRGIYSGALGTFSVTGAMDLSIVIRTLVRTGDRITLGTGGAIVAMSDPGAEWEETRVKARALLQALGAA